MSDFFVGTSATSRQLWMIKLMTGEDLSPLNLSLKEASQKISELKAARALAASERCKKDRNQEKKLILSYKKKLPVQPVQPAPNVRFKLSYSSIASKERFEHLLSVPPGSPIPDQYRRTVGQIKSAPQSVKYKVLFSLHPTWLAVPAPEIPVIALAPVSPVVVIADAPVQADIIEELRQAVRNLNALASQTGFTLSVVDGKVKVQICIEYIVMTEALVEDFVL